MVGGIATAAAVRTFPFRVYSFPKEIAGVLPDTVTVDQNFIFLGNDGIWRIDSVGSHLLSAKPLEGSPSDIWTGDYMGITRSCGPFAIAREVEIAEAKRLFPGPFHWQGKHEKVHYSVLQSDGSVVDA